MKLNAGMTAVITGAASGIGLALARAIVGRDVNAVLADRDETRLKDVASSLASDAVRVVPVVTDVSDQGSVEALAAAAAAEFGAVHLLVNNAGILRMDAVYEQPLEDWHAVFDVNVFGVIHGYRAFVPAMLEHGQACHVLNTSSMGGLIAASRAAAYMVSKHAVIALSEALAADTAGTNLGVTVLCPGGASTDIFAAELRRRQAGVTSSPEMEQRLAHIADPARADVLDPAAIAVAAIDAIERGDLYAMIFPAGPRATVRRRLAAIEAAMQVDEARDGSSPHGAL
jgi:NADP-dependent 3-hydroxy acid dehydrogenase YdfG